MASHLLHATGDGFLLVDSSGVIFNWEPSLDDGGSFGKTKKVVVRKGNKLLIFRSEAEAIAALESENADTETLEQATKPAEIQIDSDVADEAFEPLYVEETIDLAEVQRLADQYAAAEAMRQMLAQAEYLALMELFEQLRDEEDVEILLTA